MVDQLQLQGLDPLLGAPTAGLRGPRQVLGGFAGAAGPEVLAASFVGPPAQGQITSQQFLQQFDERFAPVATPFFAEVAQAPQGFVGPPAPGQFLPRVEERFASSPEAFVGPPTPNRLADRFRRFPSSQAPKGFVGPPSPQQPGPIRAPGRIPAPPGGVAPPVRGGGGGGAPVGGGALPGLAGLPPAPFRIGGGLSPFFGVKQRDAPFIKAVIPDLRAAAEREAQDRIAAFMQNRPAQFGPRAGGQAGGQGGISLADLLQEPGIQGINALFDQAAQDVRQQVIEESQRRGILASGITVGNLAEELSGLEATRAGQVGTALQDLLAQISAGQFAQQIFGPPQRTENPLNRNENLIL